MRTTVIAICAALALLMSPAVAQSTDPAPPPESPAEASIHGYGDRDKTCLTWTDKCRICMRAADDSVTCSNIGIACQPGEITCTERPSAPGK